MSRIKKIIILSAPVIVIPAVWLLTVAFRKYMIPCPVNFFTGIYCIGCGGTRCIEALLKCRPLLAMRQNFIVFSGTVFLLSLWIQLATGKKLIPENRFFYITVTGILIIYAVLRNFVPEIAPV